MKRPTSHYDDEHLVSSIIIIRNRRVMLDSVLAELYGVETKALNQAVKRNPERFPDDFMFRLSDEEWTSLKSQFVTSSYWGGRRVPPYAFTEQGVAMLSSVLKSETAIAVNIQIIRVFTRLRSMLMENKAILLKLEQLEKKMISHDHQSQKQEEDMIQIFKSLKKLMGESNTPRKRIGFKSDN